MKEMVRERIRQLGTAQESMLKLTDALEQLEESKCEIEKDAYEAMNASDRALNLSKEGKSLIQKLQNNISGFSDSQQISEIHSFMNEMNSILNKIMAASHISNDKLHTIELEVSDRCEIICSIRSQAKCISESIDQVAACAELLVTMEYI